MGEAGSGAVRLTYVRRGVLGYKNKGGVSKSMLKKSRLDFDKIEKCE